MCWKSSVVRAAKGNPLRASGDEVIEIESVWSSFVPPAHPTRKCRHFGFFPLWW
jgi:hypothetical protein